MGKNINIGDILKETLKDTADEVLWAIPVTRTAGIAGAAVKGASKVAKPIKEIAQGASTVVKAAPDAVKSVGRQFEKLFDAPATTNINKAGDAAKAADKSLKAAAAGKAKPGLTGGSRLGRFVRTAVGGGGGVGAGYLLSQALEKDGKDSTEWKPSGIV